MNKFYFLCIFVGTTHQAQSQLSDSTLMAIFLDYEPRQLIRFMDKSKSQPLNIREYVYELSFKIPTLNPIANQKITSKFGYRIHPITGAIKKHQGIDIKAFKGQLVYAAADGEITEVGYNPYVGNYIKIKHLLGYETVYGHLETYIVEKNSYVYQGQSIGFCGSTGRTTGVHLHFTIHWRSTSLNPYPFVF